MARRSHTLSDKSSLPPGVLMHVGDYTDQPARVSLTRYSPTAWEEREDIALADIVDIKLGGGVAWIQVRGVHQAEVVSALGERFEIHPLVLEDIMNTSLRPKLEEHPDFLFLAAKSPVEREEGLDLEHLAIILGKNWVISFCEQDSEAVEPVKARLSKADSRIRKRGADYLAYALLDVAVDRSFTVLEELGEEMDELEDSILAQPTAEDLNQLHLVKRRLIHLRRAYLPLREATTTLARVESKLIKSDTAPFLRDLHDHVIQVVDIIEAMRENASSLKDVFLSSVSNRMNEVMKVLAVIGTLFIPLTFLVGLYGMNFKHMPELEWLFGYPALLTFMAVLFCGMIWYFRKKKWF